MSSIDTGDVVTHCPSGEECRERGGMIGHHEAGVCRRSAMRRWIAAGMGAVLLGGCASSRLDTSPEQFVEHRSIRVAPSVVEQFVACVTEGFDGAHWMPTSVTTRQSRHVGATRIETLSGGRTLLVVVTVEDAGGVTLHEAKAAALINTRGELRAFDACAERHAAALPRS